MKLENLERVKSLMETSKKLSGLLPKYQKLSEDPNVDKLGLSFNTDDRFTVFKCYATLCGHYGYYGNSSAYVIDSINQKDAQQYFTQALNKHMALILDTMAGYAQADAKLLTDKAADDIRKAQELLTQVRGEASA
jgi:hypothetical protein